HDDDSPVLRGVVMTPVVGFGGLADSYRVESEGCRVSSVWVGLYDVPGEDAKDDVIVGPRADPA
ncbi:MAG: hypothetical protein ACRDG2_10310, partial [Actinomycetota bacterium]